MKSLQAHFNEMQRMIDEGDRTDKKQCKENFLTPILYNILKMAVDVGQAENLTEVTECRRVIKLKRINISVDELRKTHPEAIVFEGIYLITEGLYIPTEIVERMGYDFKKNKWMNLDTAGLPQDYAYSTIRILGDGGGFVLKKSDLSANINNRSSAWEYFNMQDYTE